MFSANSSQVSDDKLFVEDVFSTYLYTGNSGTQTITNGIDLAGKGGLIWLKSRSSTAGHPIGSHALFDTARGVGAIDYVLRTNLTDAQGGIATIQSVNSDGFTFGGGNPSTGNYSGQTYASWTFREAPKFFDIVTYTGTGANRNIAHNLGSVPGMIIVKRTDTTGNWQVYHRGLSSAANSIQLNLTNAQAAASTVWNSTAPTATEFTVGTDATVNASGGTYVAYLYAHDTTSDGIIQCGSYTGTDTNLSVTLGFEPQWILIKSASMSGDTYGGWHIVDNMRGLNDTLSSTSPPYLKANTSAKEATGNPNGIAITSTGFRVNTSWSFAPETYIYIAIRRGPMRTPTLGTSVFSPILSYRAAGGNNTTGFPVDMQIMGDTSQSDSNNWTVVDRLRKVSTNPDDNSSPGIKTSATSAEATGNASKNWSSTGFETPFFFPSVPAIYYSFRRAPGFFDEVCYTGTGFATTFNHNLGVVPELIIAKCRSNAFNWTVYSSTLGNSFPMFLNGTSAGTTDYGATMWGSTAPTATQFPVGTYSGTNNSGKTYVAYLFASCPGVSKVGSYTGNGSSLTIDCGFAAGARFVMIKRTDSTGDWYVWDTARGIVAGNDPHLSLNTTAAEVTTDDTIDTDSSGFVVNQDAATNVNVSSATYIYLAIA